MVIAFFCLLSFRKFICIDAWISDIFFIWFTHAHTKQHRKIRVTIHFYCDAVALTIFFFAYTFRFCIIAPSFFLSFIHTIARSISVSSTKVCCECECVCACGCVSAQVFLLSFPFLLICIFFKINFVLLSPFVDLFLLCDLNTNETSSACKTRT